MLDSAEDAGPDSLGGRQTRARAGARLGIPPQIRGVNLFKYSSSPQAPIARSGRAVSFHKKIHLSVRSLFPINIETAPDHSPPGESLKHVASRRLSNRDCFILMLA